MTGFRDISRTPVFYGSRREAGGGLSNEVVDFSFERFYNYSIGYRRLTIP